MSIPLIFVGVAHDRRTTFVDFDDESIDAAQHARVLLAQHRTSAQIEIWREELCIAVVARPWPDVTA